LNALVQRDFHVLLPFGEGHPFDLVVLVANTFLRVQCKTAWPSNGCLIFNSHTTDHGRGSRSYAGLADLFGVYFPPGDSVFLVPIDRFTGTEGRLRLEPARNNQKRRVRLAADFLIDRWTPEQLSELVSEPASAELAA
jgi:hypothetical protein